MDTNLNCILGSLTRSVLTSFDVTRTLKRTPLKWEHLTKDTFLFFLNNYIGVPTEM